MNRVEFKGKRSKTKCIRVDEISSLRMGAGRSVRRTRKQLRWPGMLLDACSLPVVQLLTSPHGSGLDDTSGSSL